MNKITLIADDGGGLTLQVTNGDVKYQHYYSDVTRQAAEDTLAALSGDDTTWWEGNEVDDGWLETTANELQNGGYQELSAKSIDDVIKWGADNDWNNVSELSCLLKDLLELEQ